MQLEVPEWCEEPIPLSSVPPFSISTCRELQQGQRQLGKVEQGHQPSVQQCSWEAMGCQHMQHHQFSQFCACELQPPATLAKENASPPSQENATPTTQEDASPSSQEDATSATQEDAIPPSQNHAVLSTQDDLPPFTGEEVTTSTSAALCSPPFSLPPLPSALSTYTSANSARPQSCWTKRRPWETTIHCDRRVLLSEHN